MQNNIANLTQEEFDNLMVNAKNHSHDEALKFFRKILVLYFDNNSLNFTPDKILSMYDALTADLKR